MSAAYCCEICGGHNPHWYLMRPGDVAVSWACDDHLVHVVKAMQRENEVTALIVSDHHKVKVRDRVDAQAVLDRLEREADNMRRGL